MFGVSYGEIFLIFGATAALIGPKDLPKIARTAGRLAGQAIGYVQMARGQFESVMQPTEFRQTHKELKDMMVQIEAIRHEFRSASMLNPGPMTRRLVDDVSQINTNDGDQAIIVPESKKIESEKNTSIATTSKDFTSTSSESSDMYRQATAYAKLAETSNLKSGSDMEKLDDELSLLSVLPVSAESAGLLPKRKDDVKGSDIVLEAIVEAEVAHNAKEFFAQPQNQLKVE